MVPENCSCTHMQLHSNWFHLEDPYWRRNFGVTYYPLPRAVRSKHYHETCQHQCYVSSRPSHWWAASMSPCLNWSYMVSGRFLSVHLVFSSILCHYESVSMQLGGSNPPVVHSSQGSRKQNVVSWTDRAERNLSPEAQCGWKERCWKAASRAQPAELLGRRHATKSRQESKNVLWGWSPANELCWRSSG